MPENNWRLNDTLPLSLAQEFAAAPGEWSGVVFWSLFEYAYSGTTVVDVSVAITGLALGALSLGNEAVTGDANTGLAGLALGGLALGNESARGDAISLVTSFSVPVALSDEAVEGDANARPAGLAVGDLVLGAVAVRGDANTSPAGFDIPVSLGDETVEIDAVATVAGLEVDTLALGSPAESGDATVSVVGLSTGAIASGEEAAEPVVPQPSELLGGLGKRNFGGGQVERVRNARIQERRGFSIAVALGTVRVRIDPHRDTFTSITGLSTGRVQLGKPVVTAEDNLTDEELIALAMAA